MYVLTIPCVVYCLVITVHSSLLVVFVFSTLSRSLTRSCQRQPSAFPRIRPAQRKPTSTGRNSTRSTAATTISSPTSGCPSGRERQTLQLVPCPTTSLSPHTPVNIGFYAPLCFVVLVRSQCALKTPHFFFFWKLDINWHLNHFHADNTLCKLWPKVLFQNIIGEIFDGKFFVFRSF